jgi:hypothetical protein
MLATSLDLATRTVYAPSGAMRERRKSVAGSSEALDRFERQSVWLMLALSLAIIPLLVIPLAVD